MQNDTQPNPTPEQPQQPAAPIQPAASSQVTSGGMAPATPANLAKQKKLAWVAFGANVAIIVVGLIFGYVFALSAILGAYAAAVGIRHKSVGLIVAGSISGGISLILFILASVLA